MELGFNEKETKDNPSKAYTCDGAWPILEEGLQGVLFSDGDGKLGLPLNVALNSFQHLYFDGSL